MAVTVRIYYHTTVYPQRCVQFNCKEPVQVVWKDGTMLGTDRGAKEPLS